MSVSPADLYEAALGLLAETDDPELADLFGDLTVADIERAGRGLGGHGAYRRRGVGDVDFDAVADIAHDLRSFAPGDSLLEAPPTAPAGIDWAALGLDTAPDYLGPDDPVWAAVRDMEPAAPRAWRKVARFNQLPPDSEWLYWLILAGRGFGKTWTGANVLADWAISDPGDYALVAPTFGDARKICVEERKSGLLTALGADLIEYNKSDYIVYVRGGSRIILGSSDSPNRLRGYNFRGAWLDELASYLNVQELWDEVLLPALRIGRLPRALITTTPKRGNPVLKELMQRFEANDEAVAVTRGKTSDNLANLSKAFVQNIYKRYGGQTVGRQELDGELLDEVEGALVTMLLIEATRVRAAELVPDLRRVVVGVDPSVTDTAASDQCGIVVMGIGGPPVGSATPKHSGEHLYILEDATLRATPEQWGRRVLDVADSWGADAIYAEKNNGGDLVETMLRMIARADRRRLPRIVSVWAAKGKRTRAEPVAGVWEQRRIHALGAWPALEDCWTSWVPGADKKSPDNLDASVWAAVGLMPELSMKPATVVNIIA